MSDARGDDEISAEEARTLAALRRALGADQPPEGLVGRAEGLITFLDVDRELLELLDREADELVGARGAATAADVLSFEAPDGMPSIEIVVELDRLDGQVLAGEIAEVGLEHLDGTIMSTAPDELGRFSFDRAGRGPVRLRLQGGAARFVTTDLFLP